MAERDIGVSGAAGADPTEPRRSEDVLLPPLQGDSYSEIISAAARRLGWRPFPIPMAINSRDNGRTGTKACQYCGYCSGYFCEDYAKNSVDITLLPRALRTGKLRVVERAAAFGIESGPDGRARDVLYREGEARGTRRVRARAVVVATSAVQTARLLLLSASGRSPRGLANGSGLVGRNLMFHLEAKGSAVFERDFHQALYKKVAVHDFYFPAPGDGFVTDGSPFPTSAGLNPTLTIQANSMRVGARLAELMRQGQL